ncbi:hypothetical protein GCM10020000_29500 [Streptomyces olivoverticillatus]
MAADAQAWARLRKVSPWPLVAAALRRDAARLARPWPTRPLWHLDAVGDREAADVPHADAALIASIRGAARPAYADCQLAEELGIELHNPYFDGAILDAVLSVPSWDRFAVHRYKPVLIDAVGDLLPELHRRRVTKGVFAEDFHQGVRVNLQRLLTLADGRLAAMGLINPGPLRAALQAAALGAKTVWPPGPGHLDCGGVAGSGRDRADGPVVSDSGGGRPMTTPRIVAVVAPYGSIVIDYRTGRVQLRSTATAAPKLPSGSVVVHHPGTALSWGGRTKCPQSWHRCRRFRSGGTWARCPR